MAQTLRQAEEAYRLGQIRQAREPLKPAGKQRAFGPGVADRMSQAPKPKTLTGQDLVNEYIATIERIADQAADRAAVVRTRIATYEAELVALDGLATQLGETT